MPSDPYSRELMDEKLKVILQVIHEVKDIAIETRDQAKRTNGRVTKLESWKSYQSGALGIISFIIIPVIGVVGWFLIQQELSLNTQVQAFVQNK